MGESQIHMITYKCLSSRGTCVKLAIARVNGESSCAVCLKPFKQRMFIHCSACGLQYHSKTCGGDTYVAFYQREDGGSHPANACKSCFSEWTEVY